MSRFQKLLKDKKRDLNIGQYLRQQAHLTLAKTVKNLRSVALLTAGAPSPWVSLVLYVPAE